MGLNFRIRPEAAGWFARYRSFNTRKGDIPQDPNLSRPAYPERQWSDSAHADKLS